MTESKPELPQTAAPLAGLRVLDLTRLLPGPAATLHLADLGAEVIKIEDTGAGDYARTLGAMRGDTSLLFQLVNRNKKSLRLDLKQPAGVAVLKRLATEADMLVESFRPGVMARLGVGYDELATLNARLVYCAITGHGQTGPYAPRAGHDINYLGYAGVLDQIGVAGGDPVVPNFQIADLLGGAVTALAAMLAALVDARRSGHGRYVDVAMTEGVFAQAYFPLVGLLESGQTPPRGQAMLSGGAPCYGVYATADGGYMAVGALEPKFWRMLCAAIGRPDLAELGLATGEEGQRVRAAVQAIFRSRTRAEWTAQFAAIDCCVTPVLSMQEALADPQLRARGMVIDDVGPTRFAPPFKLSGFAPPATVPAPAAGADSRDILSAAGYDDEEIEALVASGVI